MYVPRWLYQQLWLNLSYTKWYDKMFCTKRQEYSSSRCKNLKVMSRSLIGWLVGHFIPLLSVTIWLVQANILKKWNQTEPPSRNGIEQHVVFSTLLPKSWRHLQGRILRSWAGHLGVLLVISNTLFRIYIFSCLSFFQQLRLPANTLGKHCSCVCPPLLLRLQCTFLLFEALTLMII